MLREVLNWIQENWPEFTGSVLGLISVYFQYRQNAWLWPVSIVVAALYTYVFIQSGLYGYTLLQIYYFAISIYGWHLWVNKNRDENKVRITTTSTHSAIILLSVSLALFGVIYIFLHYVTDSDVPFADSFITSLSFIATWMLARKKLENWLVWIVADVVSVALYFHKELYATAIFYSVLSLVAIAGYFEWKRQMKKL